MTTGWPLAGLLFVGTQLSEDLTCIAAGQFVRDGRIGLAAAVGACAAGIFVGDLALWTIGRLLGRRALAIPWVARRTAALPLSRAERWLDRHPAMAVFAARFMPGARLPFFLAAGTIARRAPALLLWTAIAALVWTPLLILGVASFGAVLEPALRAYFGLGWLALLLSILACAALLRLVSAASTEMGRARLAARASRLRRWEFWPGWLMYPPLLAWIAWLSLRHRGFTTITAANPAIPHGGFVGESKHAILTALRSPRVSPTLLLPVGEPEAACAAIASAGFAFPVIVKPDAGQRGAGVRLCRGVDDVRAAVRACPAATIAQPWHPGPFEAGVFFYRVPGEPHGRILSITEKIFPAVEGDGRSTVEHLIWRHPRLRLQADVFLARLGESARRVPSAGERVALGVAGNHCQGAMFRDGSRWITPELVRAVDEIARTFDGFFFGRFDVRFADVEAFTRGEAFTIIELNGVTSESTNAYDPAFSPVRAYRTLMRQWKILFDIGSRNRRLGVEPSGPIQLIRAVVAFYRRGRPAALSD